MAYKVMIQSTITYEVLVDTEGALTFNQAGMAGMRDSENWKEVDVSSCVYDVLEL